VVDGQDVTNFENAGQNRQEIKTYCQKSRRTAKVSEMAEDVSVVAGAPSEMARSVDKKIEELGRDIEATLCSDNDTAVDDGTNGYKTRGLGSYINNSAQSTLPVPAAFRTPAASIDSTAMASLTEALFRGVLASVFIQRGKTQTLTLLCGTDLKAAITNFTQFKGADSNTYGTIRAYSNELDGKRIVTSITVYEGDFNTVNLVPSLLLAVGTSNAPTRRGYLIDWDLLELDWNKMPQVNTLPDLDGGPRKVVKAIYCLKCLNPLGFGKFAATS
jgi:hypothetical protein